MLTHQFRQAGSGPSCYLLVSYKDYCRNDSFRLITLHVFSGFGAGFAINDCGTFVRGTTHPSTFGSCGAWNDWASWSEGTKAGLYRLAQAEMDSFRDWFFWTLKVSSYCIVLYFGELSR